VDSKRFDNWARNRALRISRRDALRLAGAGGASAALAAPSRNTLAQSPCALTLQGETAGGPSAPATYDGTLQFDIGSDGALTQFSFTPDGGESIQADGSLVGRALDIRITLGSGQILTLAGTTNQKGPACPTAAAGILTGPQPGDLGAWQAMSGSAPPVLSSGQSSPGQTGSSSGSSCPPGQVTCGGSCVSACPTGQTLDQSSCACVPNQSACKPDQNPCDFDFECCGGACRDGSCTTCPGLLCGDMGCVDQMSDPNNCGVCGTVCVGDTPFCLGGACQCIPDGEPVGISSSTCCSSFGYGPTGICGCAKFGEWCAATGQCCDQGSGAVCVDAGSGFEVCCKFPGSSCSSDVECCTPTCIDGVCADNA